MPGRRTTDTAGRRRFLRAAAGLGVAAVWPTATSATPPCIAPPSDGDLDRLARSIEGATVLPVDGTYPMLRGVHQRRFRFEPLAIVQPAAAEDVAIVLDWARHRGISITPRSGGHSYIGAGGGDGIVLDLGRLDEIEAVDEDGLARIGAGARLGDVARRLHCEAGRTLPTGTCPTVGIGGITLGGGHGYVTRRHGLTCDRLREATVVRADGTIVEASADRHADLFWALRGGGGGLGVVVEMRFDTVPSTPLAVGRIEVPSEALLDGFEAFEAIATSAPPAEVSFFAFFADGEDDEDVRFAISVVVPDTPSSALAILESLLPRDLPRRTQNAFTLASPVCDGDDPVSGEWARRKSAMPTAPIGREGAEIVRSWFAARRRNPLIPGEDPARVALNGYGGAVALVPPEATAFPHRDALYSVQMSTRWNSSSSPETVAAHAAWIRGLESDLRPLTGPGCYLNYADDDLVDWSTAYWRGNLARLRSVKASVDPRGFLDGRQWVTAR